MGSISLETNATDLPVVRWGIVGAGMISSWFVQDLVLGRNDARAKHIVQAIGSSSVEKAKSFVADNMPQQPSPTIYTTYQNVYDDPSVDVVYIGTPHAIHKKTCLDAIAAGKHVLCEKPLALNAKDVREIISAAKAKGVFLMEGLWTRFHPVVTKLQQKLLHDKVIGDVRRIFCDFGLDMDLASVGEDSRLKDPALGAGSLLDIGIYSINWALLALGEPFGGTIQQPKIAAIQTLRDGIDVASSILLLFPSEGQQAILSSTMEAKTDSTFCRIEGTEGYIEVRGVAASAPSSFTIYPKNIISKKGTIERSTASPIPQCGDHYEPLNPGRGFYFEAHAIALDIAAGKKESDVMPLSETLRVMEIMDEVRRLGGACISQDGV